MDMVQDIFRVVGINFLKFDGGFQSILVVRVKGIPNLAYSSFFFSVSFVLGWIMMKGQSSVDMMDRSTLGITDGMVGGKGQCLK